MRGSLQLAVTDFSAGLVLTEDGEGLPLGASSGLLDVEPLGTHGIKRRGSDANNGTKKRASNLFWNRDSGKLLGSGAGATGLPAGTIENVTDGSSLATGLDTTRHWMFVEAPTSGGQGPVYAINGVDTPRYITAAAAIGNWTASVGSVPNGTAIAVAANRIWIASASRLYFSDINDPRSWTSTNFVDIDPTTGGGITGIATYGPYLLVFKRRAIYVVYDLNTGANRKLVQGVGHVSSGSALTTGDDGVYFVDGQRGLCVTDGSSIKPLADALGGYSGLTPVAMTAGSRFLFVFTLTYMFVLDKQMDSWWRHSLPGVGAIAAGQFDFTGDGVFFSRPSDATLRSFTPNHGPTIDTGNDPAGNPIVGVWESTDLDFDTPLKVRLRQVEVQGVASAALTGSVAKDMASSYDAGRTLTLPASGTGMARLNNAGVARTFRFKLTNAAGGWAVRRITFWGDRRAS